MGKEPHFERAVPDCMDHSRDAATTEPKAPLPAETVSLPARGFTIDRGKALAAAGVSRMEQGIVSGIAGYLLSEGDRRGLNITALLADCNPMYPDARAAAFATEAVSELVDREIPLGELLEDARKIEENVREMFKRSQSMLPAPEGYDVSQSGDDPMVN